MFHLQNLDTITRWILSSIAGVDPEFKAMLDLKSEENCRGKHDLILPTIIGDLTHGLPASMSDLVLEIGQADYRTRMNIFRLIAEYGTPDMLRPLLEAVINRKTRVP